MYKVFHKQRHSQEVCWISGNVPYNLKLIRQNAIVALPTELKMEKYYLYLVLLNLKKYIL